VSITERLFAAVAGHTRLAIVAMLVLVAGVSAGAPMVESVTNLDQFQSESAAGDKLEYIEANFTADGDTTVAQVVVQGENVLSEASLLATLRYQERLRDTEVVNRTLVAEDPVSGVANAVATAAYQNDRARELQQRAAGLERDGQQLNESFAALQRDRQQLNESFAALQRDRQQLNATLDALEAALVGLGENPSASVDAAFAEVRNATAVDLGDEQFATFQRAARQLREADSEAAAGAAIDLGTRGVLAEDLDALAARGEELESQAEALEARGAELEARAEELETRARALERERRQRRVAPDLSLAEQREQIEAANATELAAAIEAVLGGERVEAVGGTDTPLALMPTDYEVGSTSADATVLVVTQERELDAAVQGAAGQGVIDAQLAMRQIGAAADDDLAYAVLGNGIIAHEIDASMEDSLLIVAPLALLFVLVTLTVAYRDLIDILLGVFGIGAVLAMTFGFMGWLGIDFGQLFVAIPVLLIGLSIDYAIHVFMRHREQREVQSDLREAMGAALAGVGIALVFVTATTATGFLSNVSSPVPPIQEFGVVAAAGIVFALLVFCVLVPALKIELDELLEGWGLDRQKRAFGTGGGRFSRALSAGEVAARRVPAVVLLLVLVLTAAGVYGGLQVDTSFEQEEFLADDPPEWMTELPEPFTPETYTAKSTIDVVGDRFLGSGSNVELLIEGDVTQPATLERLDDTQREAVALPAAASLATGTAAIDSPLTVMRSVARTNESFNGTFAAADTDGDGVPDRDVEAVYDALFAVAPDAAGEYVHRTPDGEYRALRMLVGVRGAASNDEVTEQMQWLAADLDGDGLTATATGSVVLNTIVGDQLLDTVVESLGITLVVVFLFLMIAYRITDGSATLGAVTLLPVAFAAAWIGGSMFLLGIPFNVITGMILSLTIGIGVAYSIHVSERYTLELERQSSVTPAMRSAVTGTGGALLGSAATTVGGFGVLVLAILPPLRQFGLITALSIVYAFVGSVLVLPTLLLGWTRVAGPQWAKDELAGDAAADSTGAAAFRTLSAESVRPGRSVDVETMVTDVRGRLVLRETVTGGSVTVEGASPEPAQVVEQGETVYVAWDEPVDTAVVYYAVGAPAEATHGETVEFDGVVFTAGGTVPVSSDERVTVVTGAVEGINIQGEVTAGDLAAAARYLADGRITRGQFERVYRAWATGENDGEP